MTATQNTVTAAGSLFTTLADGERDAEVCLGVGESCETCGTNVDRVRVSYGPQTGMFDVSHSYGCFGFEFTSTTDAAYAAKWVRERDLTSTDLGALAAEIVSLGPTPA